MQKEICGDCLAKRHQGHMRGVNRTRHSKTDGSNTACYVVPLWDLVIYHHAAPSRSPRCLEELSRSIAFPMRASSCGRIEHCRLKTPGRGGNIRVAVAGLRVATTSLSLAFCLLTTPCAPTTDQADPRYPAHNCCDCSGHQSDRKPVRCEMCCVAPAIVVKVAAAPKAGGLQRPEPFRSSPSSATVTSGGQRPTFETHPPGSNRLPLYLANAALLV